MILGLLPEIRGGLGELARAGQHSRFIDGYLKPYTRAFDEIRYFSYRVESLEDYTDDAQVRASVRLLAATRWHPWARSEEHTSELQSLRHLVCRLLLEKK